jgi:hypothetical protein
MRPTASIPPGTALAIVMAALLPVGCNDRPNVPAAAALERNDTPEGQLRNVMRRLEDALARAKAASGWGVNSTRRCRYRLIPPEQEGGEYMAKVVIETSVELAPEDVPLPKSPTKREGAKTTPIGETAEEIAEDTSTVVKRTYTLAYKNRRWELADPEPDDIPATERLCFQIALSDG